MVIEADATPNPGGLPLGGQTRTELPNNHLQYAITWYGLAAGLLASDRVQPRARGRRAMSALRRATGAALALTYVLIVLGAWVRATGSGLACPDWPTCYGHWLPLPGEIPPGAGYALPPGHAGMAPPPARRRVLGPLVLVIGGLAWRARGANPRLPLYAAALVLLLLVQAGLGGLTVLDQNSPWSVALHLSTALAAVQRAVADLRAHRRGAAGPAGAAGPLASLTWLLALGTMASAAMMTKSGAALACADLAAVRRRAHPGPRRPGGPAQLRPSPARRGDGLGALALFVSVPRPTRRLRRSRRWFCR